MPDLYFHLELHLRRMDDKRSVSWASTNFENSWTKKMVRGRSVHMDWGRGTEQHRPFMQRAMSRAALPEYNGGRVPVVANVSSACERFVSDEAKFQYGW